MTAPGHKRIYSRHALEGLGLFGKTIRLGRIQHRLTAQELAERIGGFHAAPLQRIEKGDPKVRNRTDVRSRRHCRRGSCSMRTTRASQHSQSARTTASRCCPSTSTRPASRSSMSSKVPRPTKPMMVWVWLLGPDQVQRSPARL